MEAGKAERPQDDDYLQQDLHGNDEGDEGAAQGVWETAVPVEPARTDAVEPTVAPLAAAKASADPLSEGDATTDDRTSSEATTDLQAAGDPRAAGDPLSTLRRIFPGRIIEVETAEDSDEGDSASSERELELANELEPHAQGIDEELQEG